MKIQHQCPIDVDITARIFFGIVDDFEGLQILFLETVYNINVQHVYILILKKTYS